MAEENEITLWMDNCIGVQVDVEAFEIIKMMVEDVGGKDNLAEIRKVVDDLVSQGYDRSRARTLCVLARAELLGYPHRR